MKKYLAVAAFSFPYFLACAQDAKIINFRSLEQIMRNDSEKIQVINFWATWCGPCIAELPLFEALHQNRASDVKITLVNLDLDLDPNPEKVYKFISRKKLRSDIVILNEPDPNSWIDRVDSAWSGAIPATVIINPVTGKRKFVGKELKEGELEKLIAELKTDTD